VEKQVNVCPGGNHEKGTPGPIRSTIARHAHRGVANLRGGSGRRRKRNSAVRQSTGKNFTRKCGHQLVMLPWYSVFDNLAYQVDGDKVTLYGQVTRPVLKSDAEGAVKSIEGVASGRKQHRGFFHLRRWMTSSGVPCIAPFMGIRPLPLLHSSSAFHSYHREEWQRYAGGCGG